MAVAPLGQVRAVLDYALTAVAPEKIFMGIPLYGYDWPLPFVSGETLSLIHIYLHSSKRFRLKDLSVALLITFIFLCSVFKVQSSDLKLSLIHI